MADNNYFGLSEREANEIPLAETGATLLPGAIRYCERTIVRVRLKNGRIQGFYQSTGHNSGHAGAWFPFDGVKPLDDGCNQWFDKRHYCPPCPKDASLHRYGRVELREIGEALTITGIGEPREASGPGEVSWFAGATGYGQQWDEITGLDSRALLQTLNLAGDAT